MTMSVYELRIIYAFADVLFYLSSTYETLLTFVTSFWRLQKIDQIFCHVRNLKWTLYKMKKDIFL